MSLQEEKELLFQQLEWRLRQDPLHHWVLEDAFREAADYGDCDTIAVFKDNLWRYLKDVLYHGGRNGAIPSLIYRKDTEDFVKRFSHDLIGLGLLKNQSGSSSDTDIDYDEIAWNAYAGIALRIMNIMRWEDSNL